MEETENHEENSDSDGRSGAYGRLNRLCPPAARLVLRRLMLRSRDSADGGNAGGHAARVRGADLLSAHLYRGAGLRGTGHLRASHLRSHAWCNGCPRPANVRSAHSGVIREIATYTRLTGARPRPSRFPPTLPGRRRWCVPRGLKSSRTLNPQIGPAWLRSPEGS